IFLHSAFCILHFAVIALANELTVDKRSITLTDSLTITLTLTDDFAQLDSVPLNVQNLVLDGQPSTSTEFQWINGQTFRRKVFRWVAHARGPGAALVGPIALRAPGGQVETGAPAEQPQQLNVGGQFAQKLVIRRVALFPLRSGTLTIEPMAVNAAVMRRTNGFDPFGIFEGTLVEVRARSAPLRIDVRPLPSG